MAATTEPDGGEQRPNLWEELNRPRSERQPTPPPPAPGTFPSAGPEADPVGLTAEAAPNMQPVPDGAPGHDHDRTHEGSATRSTTAVAMKRIDSQHLLLVGALMFVVVTFFALRGLGGAPAETTGNVEETQAAASIVTAPDLLPAIDDTTTTSTPTSSPPSPAPEPEPTAMGLPAALLDGPQSKVLRLYRTALGREPDRAGFAYWSDQIRIGTPIETLANEFLVSGEFALQFEAAATPEQRIELLLTNAFGAPADEAQLGQWLERFRSLQGARLLVNISEADETLAATGTLR